ncbi:MULTISPECIES: helix-turn-helix transcriptional regulator [Dehalococcoides]|uniref:helix-turn-helix transcriptional regulator n=1 Tax=Dehalococcoides TaxID=61434 RepID=UPI0005B56B4C|nr:MULTISPECIES: helix-turn-helix transcriptional regulator [Dehalococcoides]QBX63308.1 XRE family transcriptional regulator [Dehalococcoides mccartyi]BAQ34102.1 putative Xre family DNA-binding protein [Dehalococcoides sp. UCH007]
MVRVELKREALEKNLIRQNCSKKELAYRIGVSRSYLSGVCSGRIEPSASMRQRFLEYFKCTFDDLFLIRDGEKCKTN